MYGVASQGGANKAGCIYKPNTDGSGFTKIHDFINTIDGLVPCSIILDGNVLYGMTSFGGYYSDGTIFKINTDGSGYTKLLDFSQYQNGSYNRLL